MVSSAWCAVVLGLCVFPPAMLVHAEADVGVAATSQPIIGGGGDFAQGTTDRDGGATSSTAIIGTVTSTPVDGEGNATVTDAVVAKDHAAGRTAYAVAMSLGIILYLMIAGGMAWNTVRGQVQAGVSQKGS